MIYGKDEYPVQITVQELQKVLKELRPSDQLILNPINNLAIIRKGEYIGWIDLKDENRLHII